MVAEAPANAKVDTFEDDARSHGVRYNLASKWAKSEVRRQIQRGASQMHAASLMRIDKDSRRKGKYTQMENRLYELFRARRVRARKCSPR